VVDVEEGNLAVVLLEDHDDSVDEFDNLGHVEDPDNLGHLCTNTELRKYIF